MGLVPVRPLVGFQSAHPVAQGPLILERPNAFDYLVSGEIIERMSDQSVPSVPKVPWPLGLLHVPLVDNMPVSFHPEWLKFINIIESA